jgi:recombination protein RecA
MAKTKEKEVDSEKSINASDKMLSSIKKDFGAGIVVDANYVMDKKAIVIPVSPALDLILGGGIPEGSFVVFTGQPKCGKTLTSLSFAANAQKPEYGNRNVYYFNVEGRIKPRDLAGIPGINKEKFHIIGSEQGNILTAEKFLQIADRVINEEPGCVVIIDSYSALCTETELTSDMDKMQRADGPKLLSKFCRKVANVIAVNKNIVIGITHLMGNPGNGHAEWKEKSGQGIGYQGDVKLRAKYHTLWSLTQEGNPIGQEVHWTVQWSALGAPGGETVSYIRYGEGIDEYKEVIELSISFGLIEKSASWYTLSFLEDKPKFQGTEKIRNYLIENKEIYNNLYTDIKKMLGFIKE